MERQSKPSTATPAKPTIMIMAPIASRAQAWVVPFRPAPRNAIVPVTLDSPADGAVNMRGVTEGTAPAARDAVEKGIYRGVPSRAMPRRETPVTTAFLSFLWPGLGHAYVRQPRRALLFAVPPALLLAGLAGIALIDPLAFALGLLGPVFAALIIGLIVIHGAWRVAAILDAWRLTRAGGPALRERTLPLVVLLSLVVVGVHLGAGVFVASFANAGSRIFTSDRPAGPNDIDNVLGGNANPAPGGGVLGSEDLNGDGRPDGDLNGDGVVDARDDLNGDGVINADDIDFGDINGDGVIDENDVVEPDEVIVDIDADGIPDEEDDDVGPPASPAPSFDPGATPPPFDPDTSGQPVIPGDGPINVLFIGLDSGFGRGHSLSDTIMVASYYPSRDTVTMISIPRDTGRLPLYKGGVYPNRINSFIGYAGRHPERFPEGPIAALMREVGYVLGIPIHYYAATNLDGLPRAVNVVGGVDITVVKAIHSEKWNYHLEPGKYHFNGEEALTFARVRYGSSDFARARRQQQVIKALAARVRTPSVAVRLPEVIDALSEVVRTNVPRDQVPTLLRILERANDATTQNIVLSPTAGYARRIPPDEVNGRYMIEPNIAAIRELSRRVFGGYSRY